MAERQFGPYRLVHRIAAGGMAEVFLARTVGIAGFEKYVALKMIHPNFAEDEEFITMLIDEAKITVQLQHVNIVQTFDLGRVDGTYYITMEFIDGGDLFRLLQLGANADLPVPFDVAAFVVREVAMGLEYAHRKRDVNGFALNIVHRDVSPQNVLVSRSGEVKLVDFGIAKASMRVMQTQAGVIKGKYYYMSPEQASGGVVDRRSDIFSAGIVLHELLSGQMLYMEEDVHKLLALVRNAAIPPVTAARPDAPKQLQHVLKRALAPNAEDRYSTAGQMARDLGVFLNEYSPVFTAAQVAAWRDKVANSEVKAETAAPNPLAEIASLPRSEFATGAAFFSDEHSLIRDAFETMGSRSGILSSGALSQISGVLDVSDRVVEEETRTMLSAADYAELSDDRTVVADPLAVPEVDPDADTLFQPPLGHVAEVADLGYESGHAEQTTVRASDPLPDPEPSPPSATPQAWQDRSGAAGAPGWDPRLHYHYGRTLETAPPYQASQASWAWLIGALFVTATLIGLVAVFVAKGRDGISSGPGQIRISSQPSGAEVYLDDVYLGLTPVEKNDVSRTARRIKIALEGHVPVEEAMVWEPGQALYERRFVLLPR